MFWSTPSRIKALSTPGRGYRGIRSGRNKRARITAQNMTISEVSGTYIPFSTYILKR
jgi:hypothetical protein